VKADWQVGQAGIAQGKGGQEAAVICLQRASIGHIKTFDMTG
jgi:hypothetical protein